MLPISCILNILEKCVAEGLVDGSKKSDRYGGFKTLIDNREWSKWFGIPSDGLWDPDIFSQEADHDRAKSVFISAYVPHSDHSPEMRAVFFKKMEVI